MPYNLAHTVIVDSGNVNRSTFILPFSIFDETSVIVKYNDRILIPYEEYYVVLDSRNINYITLTGIVLDVGGVLTVTQHLDTNRIFNFSEYGNYSLEVLNKEFNKIYTLLTYLFDQLNNENP